MRITLEQAGERYQGSGLKYPASYHVAIGHLIAFGGHGGDTRQGRKLIARALVDLQRAFGHELAAFERMSMLYISGQFPVKA
jgi:carbohydrate-selective porin OprB